jgi:hypothetical protein
MTMGLALFSAGLINDNAKQVLHLNAETEEVIVNQKKMLVDVVCYLLIDKN